MNYNDAMLTLKQTETYKKWLIKMKDRRAKAVIIDRTFRLAYGLPGDSKPVGDGVCELRIHYGPGYRIYYRKQSDCIVFLLCGGDKSSQNRDIALAKRLAKEIDDE